MHHILFKMAVMLVAAIPTAAGAETVKIVIGQQGHWNTELVQLGTDKGIFEKYNITPQITYSQGGAETILTVLSGSADLGVGAGSLGVLIAFSKGAPVRVIGAEITGSPGYWLVPADSPIRTIEDMDGKRVGVATIGAGSHAVALTAGRDYGIEPIIVPTGSIAPTYTALMSGQVDVAFAAPPFAFEAIDTGEVRMLFRDNDIAAIRDQSLRLLITRDDIDQDMIRRFVAAYEETARWMYESDEALEAFSARVNEDLETARVVRDDFYSLEALLPGSLRGLDTISRDAAEFGFLSNPLSEDQISELLRKVPN